MHRSRPVALPSRTRTAGPVAIAPRLLAALLLCAVLLPLPDAAAQAFDPSRARFVELTHPFNTNTVYWPTTPSGFAYAPISNGRTEGGWFYSAGAFQAPEHGGTHMDAPVHFKEGGVTLDKVPLSRLIAPVVVIDVESGAAMSPDYELALSDILSFEARHGPITKGTIVLMRTGWSKRWPDKREYLGDDTPGEASNLHFPGFGEAAMRILVQQRGVAAVGLDTASLDPGKSGDFMAHRVAAEAGVPGFENLTNLDQIPARGAWLMALPMLIEGGSGGPLRAVAMVPEGK
ncbi:MAG: cyclase family protein [Candidatus Binatia bacterium]